MSNRVTVQWNDIEFVDPPAGKIVLFWCEQTGVRQPRRDERMQTGYAGRTADGSWLFVIGGLFAFDLGIKVTKWAYLPDGPNGEEMGATDE